MPKRTRQQKIISKLRRLENMQEQPSLPVSQPVIKLKDLPSKPSVTISKAPTDYHYVLGDLKRTVIFVVGAIIFEIVLSLTVLRG